MAKKRKVAARRGKATRARKPARKAAKRSGSGSGGGGPKPVKTGGGAGPAEIGRAVVSHFNSGLPDSELWDRFWSSGITSVEGGRQPMAWTGRKGLDSKHEWWRSNFTVHSAAAEGPYIGATTFAIKFRIDAEEKATGKREVMEEVGVYTVERGKIVREEFCAGMRIAVPSSRPEQRAELQPMS